MLLLPSCSDPLPQHRKKLALDDDDSPFYGAQKSSSVGPSNESSALSRAAKTEGRSRSLALASVAVDGSVGDPKGKGKAIVHGGDSVRPSRRLTE